jgi:hypothetical protein
MRNGFPSRCCSTRPPWNPSSQNEPNAGVEPLRVLTNLDCPVMTSTTKSNLAFCAKFEPRLGFALDVFEWISAREKVRDEIAMDGGCKLLVAVSNAVSKLRRSSTTPAPPGNNRGSASQVHTSFEPVEALSLGEIETELAEAETQLVVAQPR